MEILSTKDNETLQTLIELYAQYANTADTVVKKQLADQMYFPTVFVWLAYKYEAYQNTNHSISTIAEIKEHSLGHDGICGKRWRFLAGELATNTELDIDDLATQNPALPIPDFIALLLNQIYLATDNFTKRWTAHEYYKVDGRVAKWESFLI